MRLIFAISFAGIASANTDADDVSIALDHKCDGSGKD